MKHINDMTRKEFEALPYRKNFNSDEGPFDSLVILPLCIKHDSGFRCMDFVLCRESGAVCRLSGCSDVLCLDGTGGYGHNWCEVCDDSPVVVCPKGWKIDCLARSGLLRLWADNGYALVAGGALSSFSVYAIEEEE
jgi:hypothetical protein